MSLQAHLLLGTDILAQAQTLDSLTPEGMDRVILDARDAGGPDDGSRSFSIWLLSEICDSPGFFSTKRVLVFRAFASDLDAEQKKQVVSFFEKLENTEDIFVFQEFSPSLNKTWKITQWYEKNTTKHDCQPFTWTRKNDSVYKNGVSWAQECAKTFHASLEADAAGLLLEHTGGDRFFLSQEIRKCSLASPEITTHIVKSLCVFEKTDAVFSASNAFLHGKNEVFLSEMRRLNENNAEVFAVLWAFQYAVRQACGLALASLSGYNAQTAASSLRLAPFQVGQYSGISVHRLRRLSQRLLLAERALKSSDSFSSPVLWLAAFLLDDSDLW